MEVFHSYWTDGRTCRFDEGESGHMVKVLRHRSGDEVMAIDGTGNMYCCRLTDDSPKAAEAEVIGCTHGWGGHPYELTLAVCPTKNADRFEWFAEKATEIGVDEIVPLIGDRSERRVFRPERIGRILVSASKQSLKAKFPTLSEPLTVRKFIAKTADETDALRLIAYCFEDESKRASIKDALNGYAGKKVVVMIGPEGDFSPEEASLALENGYVPTSLGNSRLRTETAAVTAAAATYLRYM